MNLVHGAPSIERKLSKACAGECIGVYHKKVFFNIITKQCFITAYEILINILIINIMLSR